MRNILLACMAIGVASTVVLSSASAQVTVQVSGISVDTGPSWRHHDGEWRDRGEYREPENRHVAWQRDHCVRDWGGHAYCR
jgi:hypothetical protein